MNVNCSSEKLPPDISKSWGLFNKTKDPPCPFHLNIKFRTTNIINSSIPEKCTTCGAYIHPKTRVCHICNPFVIDECKEDKYYYISNSIPSPQPKFALILIESILDKDIICRTMNYFTEVFQEKPVPDLFYFGFGFVSKLMHVFQINKNKLEFGILTNSVSQIAFVLPIQQHICALNVAANVASQLIVPYKMPEEQLFSSMQSMVRQYHFTDIIYVFSSKIETDKMKDIGCNLHFLRINQKKSSTTFSIADQYAATFMESAILTKELIVYMVNAILETQRVPIVIRIIWSEGIMFDFQNQKHILIEQLKNGCTINISQMSSELKLVGTLKISKSYQAQKSFSIQIVFTRPDLPPILYNHQWCKAYDKEDFAVFSRK